MWAALVKCWPGEIRGTMARIPPWLRFGHVCAELSVLNSYSEGLGVPSCPLPVQTPLNKVVYLAI